MTEFDYIITGAGSAGCVLANRLSAGGRLSVLLVEAGGSDRSPWVRLPIGYGKTYTDPRFNWKYFTEPDPGLSGRRDYWPRGKVLGGSSSINAMVYVRGHPGDFDDWAAMGNPGWSYADVLPYFRKFEDHAWGASAYHGAGGPLAISDIRRDIHPLCEHFISSCAAVGIARNDDFNAEHLEGAGIWQLTIRRGLRESAATAFLRPAMKRSNLAVRTQAMVTRVLFDDRRARGIEYQHKGITISARARREVIVCAGAINSPQLLQLSGVGPAPLLRQHGINVVHDLPMVGQGLQDHIAVSYSYRSRVPTLNDELYPLSGKIRAGLRYLFARRGILGMSVNQAGAFASSRPGLARPNLQLYFNPLAYPSPTPEVRRLLRPHAYSGFVMSFNTCRPTSRGVIDIVSRDPYSPPAIKVNSLATEHDRADIYAGSQLLRRIAAAAPLRTIIDAELAPGPELTSPAALLEDFRQRSGTVFHPCSTCAMGPDPLHSVVDAQLRVHGMEGLRVVDASIFPTVTSGNTNAPVIMVAEKAADLILKL